MPVSGIAAGRVRYGGRGCRSICGRCRGGVLRAIMRNFFGYAVISAVLKRKRLLICNSRKMAKTELYNERKREGRREEGEIEKAACSAGAGSV